MRKQLTVLLILLCVFLILSACASKTYRVDYDGSKELFLGAKDSYRAGEKVTLYYPFIATVTSYAFYLDGEKLDVGWTEFLGYRIRFTMPERDVTLTCESRNDMVYNPEYVNP